MNRIKQLRDELKISQSELGKKLNKVIWILIGLIIITYLIMRFVNF